MTPFTGITHMPYAAEDGRLVFCRADEITEREIPLTTTAARLGLKPQQSRFRAWDIYQRDRWDADPEQRLELPVPTSARMRYCSPVLSEVGMSFIYSGRLWLWNFITAPQVVADKINTGCVTKRGIVTVDYATEQTCRMVFFGTALHLSLDVLRVVPALGIGGWLVTFRENFATFHLDESLTTVRPILVDGRTVYKSCLAPGGGILHARRKTGFEDREVVFSSSFDFGSGLPFTELQKEVATGDAPDPRQSQQLWNEFHTTARNDAITADWLEQFNVKVDLLAMCDCGRHWRKIVEANPLPKAGQFEWSVNRHNDVRSLQSKPLFTIGEAQKLYAMG